MDHHLGLVVSNRTSPLRKEAICFDVPCFGSLSMAYSDTPVWGGKSQDYNTNKLLDTNHINLKLVKLPSGRSSRIHYKVDFITYYIPEKVILPVLDVYTKLVAKYIVLGLLAKFPAKVIYNNQTYIKLTMSSVFSGSEICYTLSFFRYFLENPSLTLCAHKLLQRIPSIDIELAILAAGAIKLGLQGQLQNVKIDYIPAIGHTNFEQFPTPKILAKYLNRSWINLQEPYYSSLTYRGISTAIAPTVLRGEPRNEWLDYRRNRYYEDTEEGVIQFILQLIADVEKEAGTCRLF